MKQPPLVTDGLCNGPLFAPPHKRRGNKASLRGAARWRFLQTRVPPWADLGVLAALRKLKQIYNKELGLNLSEDHLVPLNHPLVCGLHTPDNIEIVDLLINQKKGNSTWPDMPDPQLSLFNERNSP